MRNMKEQWPPLRKATGEPSERSIFQLESGGSKDSMTRLRAEEIFTMKQEFCAKRRKLGLRTAAK